MIERMISLFSNYLEYESAETIDIYSRSMHAVMKEPFGKLILEWSSLIEWKLVSKVMQSV